MSKVMLKGKSSKETPMSPDQNVSECMCIVSIGDLVKWTIARQRMTIEQLEAYIADDYSG